MDGQTDHSQCHGMAPTGTGQGMVCAAAYIRPCHCPTLHACCPHAFPTLQTLPRLLFLKKAFFLLAFPCPCLTQAEPHPSPFCPTPTTGDAFSQEPGQAPEHVILSHLNRQTRQDRQAWPVADSGTGQARQQEPDMSHRHYTPHALNLACATICRHSLLSPLLSLSLGHYSQSLQAKILLSPPRHAWAFELLLPSCVMSLSSATGKTFTKRHFWDRTWTTGGGQEQDWDRHSK